MWNLRTAQLAIVVGGCLSAAYTQLSTSPATIAFARSLGATGLHIGIAGALPAGFLFMQLVAAAIVPRLQARKPLFFLITLPQRMVLVPAALGPWLLPSVPDEVWVAVLLAVTALTQALAHFAHPLWMSWMGDYLPHKGLNRYWGVRELCMQATAAGSLLIASLLFLKSGLELRAAHALLICGGSACGVIDILLLVKVFEPELERGTGLSLANVFREPFRHAGFRSFISFSTAFNFAAMIGAPFISLFLLEYVGLDVFQVLIVWTLSWVGGAVFSRTLGVMTERFGQRPMLILCVMFKSLIMIALLAIPPQSATLACWVLTPVFMFDAALNSGITIANAGFMIKHSPREHRPMFIAAGNAFAGMAGGVASIAAGLWLNATSGWSWGPSEWPIVSFHLLFGASLLLRLICVHLARGVREPTSIGTRQVVLELYASAQERLRRLPVPRRKAG